MTVLLLSDVLFRTPDTYHLAGLMRGTVTSNFHARRDNLEAPGAGPESQRTLIG
ncbi:MAG: hypothetical protein ACRDY0_07290 [Acidimicrobiales bacterium]